MHCSHQLVHLLDNIDIVLHQKLNHYNLLLGFEDNPVLSNIFVDLLFDVRDKTIGELVHVSEILEERNDDLV